MRSFQCRRGFNLDPHFRTNKKRVESSKFYLESYCVVLTPGTLRRRDSIYCTHGLLIRSKNETTTSSFETTPSCTVLNGPITPFTPLVTTITDPLSVGSPTPVQDREGTRRDPPKSPLQTPRLEIGGTVQLLPDLGSLTSRSLTDQ